MLDFLQGLTQVPKRLAIMGGTFDPIHYAHLTAAEFVRDEMQLDQVLFLPSGNSYFKENRGVTPAETRYLMTTLAIQDNPGFCASRIEIEREGRTYTIDTIHQLRRELPDTQLYFIVGTDTFLQMPTWYQAEELLHSCSFLVVNRGGYDLTVDPEIYAGVDYRQIQIPSLKISSTEIRERIQEGRSVKYLLPDPVLDYIMEHQLYMPKGCAE